MRHGSASRQQGMTLIEVMVAIVLGLLVTAAIIQLFETSKRSYTFNESMARLQESGRFAMTFLSYDTRMADYDVNPGGTRVADEAALVGENNTGVNGSDKVTFTYEAVEGGATLRKSFAYSVQNGPRGTPSLFRSEDGGTAMEVTEGIENLQILYGEDINDDYIADLYVDWGNVANRAQVVALKLTVTARTLSEHVKKDGGIRALSVV